MTDLTPSGGGDTAPANDTPLSLREAADALYKRREAPETPQSETPAEPVEPSEPELSSHEEDTAADNLPPGDDDQGQVDPADDQPSIEPPRSWTKEEKEAFKLLPPEKQATIAERERTREAAIRRGQDEVAEQRKAADAERQRLEQARQQYEAALPQLMQQLSAQQNAEFADIRSHADVVKMAEEDPFRYAKWDALQKQRQAVHTQAQQAQVRQQQHEAETFKAWAAEQDKLITERIPELADPKKAEGVQKAAVSYLKDTLGWDTDKIGKLWSGQEKLSARDADFQLLINDAAKWRSAQKKVAEVAAKPVPPVQRPGTAPSKGDAQQAQIKALETRLERASSTQEQIRLAAQLRSMKRANGAR